MAASGPDRSLPAIGCPPAYRSVPATPASASSGAVLTLPTSVTIASVSARARAISGPMWSGGTATTTRPTRLAGVGPAGAQPERGAEVLRVAVGQQHLDVVPAQGQPQRGADQAGADDQHRVRERLTHRRRARPGRA